MPSNGTTKSLVAEILTNYLPSHGFLVFCTKVLLSYSYCPNNPGTWELAWSNGIGCETLPLLHSAHDRLDGWQRDRTNANSKPILSRMNRLAKGEVTIIPPVWFAWFIHWFIHSFADAWYDEEYDDQRGHYYSTIWIHLQCVLKDSSIGPDWKEMLLQLLQKFKG